MKTIFSIIVLLLDIWAIVSVLKSGASGLAKAGWIIGVLVFPVLGFLVWFFAGPKGTKAITS